MLGSQRFLRGEYREGEKCLWQLLPVLTKEQRRGVAQDLGQQLEAAAKIKEAVQAWNFLAWAFATSPDPRMLDPEEAMLLAQHLLTLPNQQQNPLSLDTLAAAQAAAGQYDKAQQAAQAAIGLANSQGNRALAEAIAVRLQSYKQGQPYRCNPDGSDRPYGSGAER